MQYIVLIALLVDVLDRHLWVEEFIELCTALPVMTDRSFSQISLPTVFQILVAPLLKGEGCSSCHFQLFHCKISFVFIKKYWTHHERIYVYDVSNFFVIDFCAK